jgi:glycosyltransferase involved in cell wall biosynthesis
MKILHIRSTSFFGGPERQLLAHAREFKERGHDVAVICLGGRELGNRDLASRLEAIGVRSFVVDGVSPYSVRAMSRLWRYMFKENWDLICTHDYRATILAVPAAAAGVAVIAFSRGYTEEGAKVSLLTAIERQLLPLMRLVIAVSRAQQSRLESLGVNARCIRVVRNAVDVGIVAASGSMDLESRFQWPGDSIIFLWAGRFSREKDPLLALRAFDRARRVEPRLRLVMFGEGPLLLEVRAEVRVRGLADYCALPGFEPAIVAAMCGATALLSSSESEGLPNNVLEAAALGLPIVATAVGGIPEVIEDNVSGLLVQYGAEELLAQAMLKVAGNREAASELGRVAKVSVTEQFSFQRQSDELEAIFFQAVQDVAVDGRSSL